MREKIFKREELIEIVRESKEQGKCVGYTSGAFDLLHAGHAEYLEAARKACDLLVVGVNTDNSIRQYKGSKRPVVPEGDRIELVSSLQCVDYAFLFDERNNNRNVELLKPSKYIKAGDYTMKTLSSAPLVQAYGGEVEIIPLRAGLSTSALIERVLVRFADEVPRVAGYVEYDAAPAVFLDRDGTLVEEVEYLHEPEKLIVLPGVPEALARLQELGFRLVIVTQQPGIGLGYYSKEDFFRVNKALFAELSKAGVRIDRVYYCPHSKADLCQCRKPAVGMVEKAVADLNIDLNRSFVIGDSTADVALANNVGCRAILVATGKAGRDGLYPAEPDCKVADVKSAVAWIQSQIVSDIAEIAKEKFEGEVKVADEPLSLRELEAIGRVAGKIGHDLNNLLGAIRGCVDLIKVRVAKGLSEANTIDRQISIMETALQRAQVLTAKIRGFIKPGPIALAECRLLDLVEAVVSFLKGGQKATVDIEVVEQADPFIKVNPFQTVQMLVAIALNAIAAMEELEERCLLFLIREAKIGKGESECLDAGRYVQLVVIDHGLGMSKEALEMACEPFFSTKAGGVGEGFGLSLAMAREIMKKQGGAIQLVSQKECGTAVVLYFPL